MSEYPLTSSPMTLRDYLKIIFRHKEVVVISFASVMIAVLVGLIFMTPQYQGQVKMLILAEKQVESPYHREIIGLRDMQLAVTQSEIVTSYPVMELAVKALKLDERPFDYEAKYSFFVKKPIVMVQGFLANLGLKTKKYSEQERKDAVLRMAVDNLRSGVKVDPIPDTNMFIISVRDYTAKDASLLANAVSRAYVIFDLQQQLAELQLKYGEKHPSALQLKENIDRLTKNLNGELLPTLEALGPASVKVIEQAGIPDKPAGLPRKLLFLLAAFAAALFSMSLAFIIEYIDPTFNSRVDIERFLNLPFLGSIYNESYSENYRNLVHQIYMLMKDKKLKTILFTSAAHEEGAAAIVESLGRHFSDIAKDKVLLIDANLRAPSLHLAFNLSSEPGLAEVLEGKATLDKAVQQSEGISVLASGKVTLNPITLLDSSMMTELFTQIKQKYGVVLINCSDLRSYRDAVDLALNADGVVLVISEGKTRRPVVKEVISPLYREKVNILGVVLTNRKFLIPEKIYNKL